MFVQGMHFVNYKSSLFQPEGSAQVLGLLAGIGKHQRFSVLHAVVHILVPRVKSRPGGALCRRLRHCIGNRRGSRLPHAVSRIGRFPFRICALPRAGVCALILARVLNIEMLQSQPPSDLSLLKAWDIHRRLRAACTPPPAMDRRWWRTTRRGAAHARSDARCGQAGR